MTATTTKIHRPARRVHIVLMLDTWMVLYVDRHKHQKKAAASFYAPDHSREFVENWVLNNPKLELTS